MSGHEYRRLVRKKKGGGGFIVIDEESSWHKEDGDSNIGGRIKTEDHGKLEALLSLMS